MKAGVGPRLFNVEIPEITNVISSDTISGTIIVA